MKKLNLIIALILICFGIKAIAGNDEDCYVKTADKTYVGKDLKIGLSKTKIFLADGTFTEFKNHDIVAYRHHDKLYMMMPVVCNSTDTLCMAMMEYVTSKPGYTVFLYCCYDNGDQAYLPSGVYRNYFFVYKDGKYYRRINEDQTEALAAFGIKVI